MATFSPELLEAMHGDAAVLKYLNMMHEQYICGDREAILGALSLCAKYQAIIPEWVTDELLTIEDKVNSGATKDLNEFFGFKPENKAKQAKKYKIKKAIPEVYGALFDHRLSGGNFTTDDGLASVSEKTLEPRRIVEGVYNQHKESLKDLPAKKIDSSINGYMHINTPQDLGRRTGRNTLKD